jgi:putative SOS response-associated peptidase YedK
MCGRYYSLFDKQQIAEHFHVRRTADNVGIIAPNWNVAPGDPQPVIRRGRETGERELVMMRWGVVPCFAKSEAEFKALSTINAKSDRLTDSKMWREPFAKRRCLVPASGLYEWPKHNKIKEEFLVSEVPKTSAESGDLFDLQELREGSGDLFPIKSGPAPAAAAHSSGKPLNRVVRAKPVKQVFAITLADQSATPFAFAGIWDSWKRPDGTRLETFAIVTTEPNELVAQIHDRLALILHPRDYDRWLGIPETGDPRPPFDLLHPYDAARMKMTPANPAVGNWRNNGPEMLQGPR